MHCLFFYVWYLPCFASINTGTNFVLFNCLYFRRPLSSSLPLAVWNSRLDHLLQNLQFEPIANIWTDLETLFRSASAVVVLCRHTHLKLSSLAEFRNHDCCCCCCCFSSGIALDTSHTVETLEPRGGATPAGSPSGAGSTPLFRDLRLSLLLLLFAHVTWHGFSPKNTDTAYRQIIKYNNKQQVYMITT